MMSTDRPTVLILASNPAFAREVTANWPQDPAAHSQHAERPEFIVLDEAFSRDLQGSHYDLAIADASYTNENDRRKDKRIHEGQINEGPINKDPINKDLRQSLVAAGKPALIIHSDPARDFCNLHGSVIDLRREPGIWPMLAGLIGREILRRRQAEGRARDAEKISAVALAEATLGRYMLEMRTNVNNALTSVLGNAELLVLEPGLPATVMAQADTIRNMALRLHEVFQRFSSLEKELTVVARESDKKNAQAAGRG